MARIGNQCGIGRPAAMWAAALLAAGMMAVAPTARADTLDCTGDLGDPVSGSPEWQAADLNNRECAAEGRRILANNPAVTAAKAANIAAGAGNFDGDPFRAPYRWADQRGRYMLTTYTDRDGVQWSAALFSPLKDNKGQYPGVLLVCHICQSILAPPNATPENTALYYWAAESLAEAGYVVMMPSIGNNVTTRAIDATDFFVATPEVPSPRGEFNPWWAKLDRTRLAIVGHSGAGFVALDAGMIDPRFEAIVALDPVAPPTTLRDVPTMLQLSEYGTTPPDLQPHSTRPIPAPGSKYTFFDTFRAAGIDTMQVVPRSSTHQEWCWLYSGCFIPNPRSSGVFSIYGQMVGTYYMLAWLDRYLAPSKGAGTHALNRLTDTHKFDRSADAHSIGSGFFSADQAQDAESIEAGNVPFTIGEIPIGNLLSFEYPSRYFLNGGALQCGDLRDAQQCIRPPPSGLRGDQTDE